MHLKCFGLSVLFFSCTQNQNHKNHLSESTGVSLYILGTLQDGGSPHTGCKNKCCKELFTKPNPYRKVVSLGLVDYFLRQCWLFEATPDISTQMKQLKKWGSAEKEAPTGIFVTHAHIGHYSGLMYLGREAMNTRNVSVYCLPRMKSFIESNGPWSQLVKLENILLQELCDSLETKLTASISVKAFRVPHRDEFSETAGFLIKGPNKTVLFIPDIDKWEKWDRSIIEEIKKVDYAFIDGTFFSGDEINTRNIKEIPHPFVIESMELFKQLPASEKQKIYFIHFNHSNPLLNKGKEYQEVIKAGFNVSEFGLKVGL